MVGRMAGIVSLRHAAWVKELDDDVQSERSHPSGTPTKATALPRPQQLRPLGNGTCVA